MNDELNKFFSEHKNFSSFNLLPNDDMKMIADRCGESTAIKLMQEFGGTQIYIPKPEKLITKDVIVKFMEVNPTKKVTDVASQFNLSKATLYNILHK